MKANYFLRKINRTLENMCWATFSVIFIQLVVLFYNFSNNIVKVIHDRRIDSWSHSYNLNTQALYYDLYFGQLFYQDQPHS
jgi:phosphate starvation-inducible membrane PsiE